MFRSEGFGVNSTGWNAHFAQGAGLAVGNVELRDRMNVADSNLVVERDTRPWLSRLMVMR